MPTKTGISWTDYTSNPIRYRDHAGAEVWACVHKSAGCVNCYAEAMALRFHRGQAFIQQHIGDVTPFLHAGELAKLRKSTGITGKRVFIGDMTDIFGEWVGDVLLWRLWILFAERHDVTFQILTKRPHRMRAALATIAEWFTGETWPLPNVWLGVSAEDQAAADERIPILLDTPAAVHYVSAEPLIGAVNLNPWLPQGPWCRDPENAPCQCGPHLDWVIVGGESGPKARPMDLAWARQLRAQCEAKGVAFFFKQESGRRPERNALLGGTAYHAFPRTVGRPLIDFLPEAEAER